MIKYTYDRRILSIQETAAGRDVEFQIEFHEDNGLEAGLLDIQRQFDNNEVITDVMFYSYPHRKHLVVVRQDFYIDFVLALMKQRLLLSVQWE
ncbi:hypothetical protein [Paenibacillus sp. NFR01]|uniref:hypothetical protein n=1 Tax=Paenibacillus sp. NFR01 TaxID=1566279 RepID=UPI0008CB7DAC|nr:hypothetical protein [Paenibacillus sp. NFR01]SEU02102.1 hypothetical protein SAMN03159358_3128 [Paenibacillus sp. NFR01]